MPQSYNYGKLVLITVVFGDVLSVTLLHDIFATGLFRAIFEVRIFHDTNFATFREFCSLNHFNFAFVSMTQFISLAISTDQVPSFKNDQA